MVIVRKRTTFDVEVWRRDRIDVVRVGWCGGYAIMVTVVVLFVVMLAR